MTAQFPQAPPPDIADALARASDALGSWAGLLHWYEDIGSTNDTALALAEQGGREGLVVAADAQHAGRGRVGRQWFSPRGAGLYLSCILRPSPDVLPLVTLAAGLGVAEGIGEATGLYPMVKWPNDLLIEGRKVGGILAETGVGREGGLFAVVGVGINVTGSQWPADIRDTATALDVELGRPIERAEVMASCLAHWRGRYEDLRAGRGPQVVDAWRARASAIVGRRVEWDDAGTPRRGVVHAIADDGALRVQAEDGVVRIASGEVRWC